MKEQRIFLFYRNLVGKTMLINTRASQGGVTTTKLKIKIYDRIKLYTRDAAQAATLQSFARQCRVWCVTSNCANT